MPRHKITLRRTERRFYKDGQTKDWSYDGDDITFECPDEPDQDLISEIEARFEKFKRLQRGRSKVVIKESFMVDWATFVYYAKKSKMHPGRPNSCFSVDLVGWNPYHSFLIMSPPLNFYNNPFNP